MTAQNISQLHSWKHDDYAEAARDIWMALGDISKEEIFGRQVLCAVYVRPNEKTTKRADGTVFKVHFTTKAQEEDIWQGKVMLVLKLGPGAFKGEVDYLTDMFGTSDPEKLPKVGDWLFAQPSAGVPMSVMGAGAARPKGVDHRGDPTDKFEWDGWPCRILSDDLFFGRMSAPHVIV